MNEIEIDITIKMGDTCENTMKLSEARALYFSLHDIFGGMITVPEQHNPGSHGEVRSKIINDKEPDVVSGVKMPPPNLKVEAARQRAAERTRGCGGRNK
jgi:hypothetical protein